MLRDLTAINSGHETLGRSASGIQQVHLQSESLLHLMLKSHIGKKMLKWGMCNHSD